ncbi:MAG: hypothetical protein QM658_16290 [Gordonia sp. (in: high G+C Gram-positive bacteria)]
MTIAADHRLSEALRTAERLMTARAGINVTLSDPEDLGGGGRSVVVRARVVENASFPGRSVVLKAFDDDSESDQFLREVASYRYATALPNASRPGPQLLASDVAARLLVLTDLGHGRSMVEQLADNRDSATRGVSAWGQALGRMHAATFGGEDDFAALVRLGAKAVCADDMAGQAAESVRSAGAIAERLGVTVPDRLIDDLLRGCTLFDEGEFRAFSPSDVGPENILLGDDGVQFMDYEFGAFRDATLDVGYALVTFPALLSEASVGSRGELETRLVDAWRSEVQALWPTVFRDADLYRRILIARTLWVWLSTYWMIVGDSTGHDWALHTGDARVVLARWADLADSAHNVGDAELAELARRLERALKLFWLE